MLKMLRTATILFMLLTIMTGVLYPGAMTALGAMVFAGPANGSIVVRDGHALGSSLLGQPFSGAGYFWGRPSATAPQAYNGGASTGTNHAPTNPALSTAVAERIARLRAADPGNDAAVPIDLVTSSGSGLDPHISPAAAEYQVRRVARVRGLPEATIRQMVAQASKGRTFGILGEPRVNVLELNLALDARH
jgi:K+-transporting ATPase ATPase C chain